MQDTPSIFTLPEMSLGLVPVNKHKNQSSKCLIDTKVQVGSFKNTTRFNVVKNDS